jgi:hypothetical protein
VRCDLVEFERLLAAGDRAAAAERYGGPFLDGFHAGGGAEEFERWADAERDRIALAWRDAVHGLAVEAAGRSDHAGALRWWRRLAAVDPLSGRYAREVVGFLAALGDQAGAIRHAEVHRERLRAELGMAADASLDALVTSLRTATPVPSRASVPVAVPVAPPAASAAVRAVASAEDVAPPAPAPARLSVVSTRPRSHLRSRTLVVVGVAALAGSVMFLIRTRPARHTLVPSRVAVVAFQPGDDTAVASTRRLVGEAIGRRLISGGVTSPVVVLQPTDGDGLDAGSRAGAGLVVSVGGTRAGEATEVDATLLDAATGERLWISPRLTLRAGGEAGAADTLAERTATAVAVRLDPMFRNWIAASSEPSSLSAYREFRRGLQLYDTYDGVAATHFSAAASDTAFAMARIAWVLASLGGDSEPIDSVMLGLRQRALKPHDRALVDHLTAYLAHDREMAYTTSADIGAAAPLSEWRFLRPMAALRLGKAREAVRVLDDMRPHLGWLSDASLHQYLLGASLHYAGAHERELAEMEAARRRFPGNRIIVQMLIKALAARGRVEDVNREVDRAMSMRQHDGWSESQPMNQAIEELRGHGHAEAARHLAARTVAWVHRLPPDQRSALDDALPVFLFEAGDLREARRLQERLAARDKAWESLAFLGIISAAQGDRESAGRVDARLARHAGPREELLASRAGIAAWLGDREKAVRLLREALRAGYEARSILHMLVDFAPLRGYAPFEELARPVD